MTLNVETGATAQNFTLRVEYSSSSTDRTVILNNNGTIENAKIHGHANANAIFANNKGTIKNSEFANANVTNEQGATIEDSSLVRAGDSRSLLTNLGTVKNCAFFGAYFMDDEYGTITNCVAWGDNEFPEGVQAAEITIDGDARWTITDPRMPDRLATDKFYIVGSPTLKIQIWDDVKRTIVPLSNIDGDTNGITTVEEDGEKWYQFTPDSTNKESIVLNVLDEHQLTVTGGGVIKAINGTDTTGSPTTAQVKETLKVTLEAPEPDGKTFKEWKVTAGTAPTNFVYKRNEYYNLIDNPTSFYMPEGDVTLEAIYYNEALEIGEDGKPVTEGREPYGNGGVQGDGWTYDGTTLKLNPMEAKTFDLTNSKLHFLDCELEVGENATVVGRAFLCRPVTNNGTINGPNFHKENYKYPPKLTNNGTVENCYIDYGSVTNNGTMENVSFLMCTSLTNNAGATIKNAVVRTDGRNMAYNNSGTIKNAVFEFKPSGETVHVLKTEGDSKNPSASVEGCSYGVSASQVYIIGEPVLKARIYDTVNRTYVTITNVNGNTSYGGLTANKDQNNYQKFTVQSGDTELVLNKTISPTYDENLVIGTDGKPNTANSEPYGNGWKGANWTYDGTTLTLSGGSWRFSNYPAVTCPVALGYNTGLIGGTFEKAVTGGTSSYVDGGIFLSTVNVAKIDSGIFKTAPNGTTCYTVKAGDSSKLGVKVNGAEFVDFGTDEARVVGDIEFSVQLRDTNDDVVKITNINGKEIGSAYGSHYVDNSTAVKFTMPSANVVLNQEPTTTTYSLTVNGGYIDGDKTKTSGDYEAGATITLTANEAAEGKQFNEWQLDGLTLKENHYFADTTIVVTITGNATAKATYKNKTYKLTLETDGTEGAGIFYSHNGNRIDNDRAFLAKDDTAELKADVPEGKQFDRWELSDGVTLVDGSKLTDATIKIKMPGKEATAKAFFKDKASTTYTLTVDGGYIGDDETKTSGEFEANAEIKVTAKAKTGYHFTKWTVEKGNLNLSEEELEEKLKANPLTFEMPDGALSLKANYEEDTPDPVDPNPTPNPDDQSKTYTVTVKGGKINNKTEEKAKKGIELTVDVDEKEVPEGMTFDVWSIRFPEGIEDTLTPSVKLHDPHMTFTMPGADITIEAQYRSSELPGEDDGPSTLGTMATVAVGGAAAGILVWQGVSLGVDSYLQLNLPKGVAVPANRRELVVLLWETAGKPETALPSLYSDVPAEEIELQKATRWAIDNGLVKPADDSDASRFDPDRYVTKYDVFGAWLKLKKLMKL